MYIFADIYMYNYVLCRLTLFITEVKYSQCTTLMLQQATVKEQEVTSDEVSVYKENQVSGLLFMQAVTMIYLTPKIIPTCIPKFHLLQYFKNPLLLVRQ